MLLSTEGTTPAITINQVSKTYGNGFEALKNISISIQAGEIFALLGANGAGKTTLINSICGIVRFTSGQILVQQYDVLQHYRQARALIGMVPQELTTDAFETVWDTVNLSRGLFGKPANKAYIEEVLKKLSLWDKRDAQLRTLSGGMKRRVMIAKALAHEPSILFLDEPTAGVDVGLRKSMWEQVKLLRETGVTIILTTHYIEEAEMMADRIGVIHKGELLLTEAKHSLMQKLGKKTLVLHLQQPLEALPSDLEDFDLEVSADGLQLSFHYSLCQESHGVAELLNRINNHKIAYKDMETYETSLEDIFVKIVQPA